MRPKVPMEFLKIAMATLFVLFGLFIIVCSWVRQVGNARARKDPGRKWSSPVPFFGPILCIVGYANLPLPFSGWAFLLFAVDPDTVVTLAGILYLLTMRLRGKDVSQP